MHLQFDLSHWLIYGKACHLPVKLAHETYWTLKTINLNVNEVGAGPLRNLQINELDE